MRLALLLYLLLLSAALKAQQGFAFTRFSTEDGSGLSSNVVTSIFQDNNGFIWVGTANGLQRFDGSKFVHFGISTGDPMPQSLVSQIVPFGKGQLVLNYGSLHQLGIFSPVGFAYKRIEVKTQKPVSPKADYFVWRDKAGKLYLNIFRHGILSYNEKQNAFVDNNPFSLPEGFMPATDGIFEDTVKQQVWFAGDKGLAIYDQRSKQLWHRGFNPRNIPILKNDLVQDRPSDIFIDQSRRIWVIGWPLQLNAGQVKFCLDSTGTTYLQKDTMGLNSGPVGYAEYRNFLDTKRSGLWVYGMHTLFNWTKTLQRFTYIKSVMESNHAIEYDVVYQMLEDRDGNIWLATDRGLYFASFGTDNFSVINFLFDGKRSQNNITDVLEMPNGDLWFSSWVKGW